jgi:tetratricopeptide (TPR) repeat protein
VRNKALANGESFLEMGDLDSAISAFTEATQSNPTAANAYYGRGIAYRKKGDDDSAIADFAEAIRLAPKRFEAYINRGRAYGNKGGNGIENAVSFSSPAARARR